MYRVILIIFVSESWWLASINSRSTLLVILINGSLVLYYVGETEIKLIKEETRHRGFHALCVYVIYLITKAAHKTAVSPLICLMFAKVAWYNNIILVIFQYVRRWKRSWYMSWETGNYYTVFTFIQFNVLKGGRLSGE